MQPLVLRRISLFFTGWGIISIIQLLLLHSCSSRCYKKTQQAKRMKYFLHNYVGLIIGKICNNTMNWSTLFYCKQTKSLIIGWIPNFALFQPFSLNLTDLMKFLPPVHSSSHCLCPLTVSISILQVGRWSVSHQEFRLAARQRLWAEQCPHPRDSLPRNAFSPQWHTPTPLHMRQSSSS